MNVMRCDATHFLRSLKPESVDLVLFSPPYDGVREYRDMPGSGWGGWGKDIKRALRPGGMAVVVVQDQTTVGRKSLTTFKSTCAWAEHLALWECLIYQRPGNPGAWWSKRFRVDHEYILVFVKGSKPAYFNKEHMLIASKHAGKKWSGTQRHSDGTLSKRQGVVAATKCPGTVLSYASSNTEGNKLKSQHPTTMPAKLAEDFIQAFCPPGGVVVDPCCGSGTTLVAAKKLGRNYLGCDVDPTYVTLTKQRLGVL